MGRRYCHALRAADVMPSSRFGACARPRLRKRGPDVTPISAPSRNSFIALPRGMNADRVLLTQENRSFDRYFGTLGGGRGFDDPAAPRLADSASVFAHPTAARRRVVRRIRL